MAKKNRSIESVMILLASAITLACALIVDEATVAITAVYLLFLSRLV